MPSRYSRFGQVCTLALRDHFSSIGTIEVPSVGVCTVENVLEPYINSSTWSFTFDLRFPNSYSSMTLGVFTFGSCLMDDTEQVQLPPADFEEETEKEFPKEHQDAWCALRDAVREELTGLGLRDGSDDDSDFYLIDDYYPSRGIAGSLHNPAAVTFDLASRCQSLLQKHAGWNFWIQFDLDFSAPDYAGRDERLLIREDRIVLDMNVARLEREFPGNFKWEPPRAL